MKTRIVFILLFFSFSFGAISQNKTSDSTLYYKKENRVLKSKIDSLEAEIYRRNFYINTAKYYIRITQKRPANKKFFFGWMVYLFNDEFSKSNLK